MTTCNIGGGCSADTPVLDQDAARDQIAGLAGDWQLSDEGTTITRRITVKGFAKAVYLANLAAWMADQHGHHPDVAFGWGYCAVSYTTHEAGGLTEVDIACAREFDALLA
ncbi:4a-hydroxytetrahydrobiopterin dehydratase [Marinovum sp.]|uniref:4a-hydroxytetrahydrobiopterin dehydratase n=1 Tax=Marinovum sp. TaxID=2024839 RepID=UPI002B2739BC|nr:4a-hydroxytetrahydrobiopterin dehydratase [Marinovum sp.]